MSSNVFRIAAQAMAAQSVRLNTITSNLANADSVANTPEGAYQARQPVFVTTEVDPQKGLSGVGVQQITQTGPEPKKQYMPGHPLADPDGYVYASNVNPVEEMVNMVSTARSYQNMVEVMNTTKELMLRTLNMGNNN